MKSKIAKLLIIAVICVQVVFLVNRLVNENHDKIQNPFLKNHVTFLNLPEDSKAIENLFDEISQEAKELKIILVKETIDSKLAHERKLILTDKLSSVIPRLFGIKIEDSTNKIAINGFDQNKETQNISILMKNFIFSSNRSINFEAINSENMNVHRGLFHIYYDSEEDLNNFIKKVSILTATPSEELHAPLHISNSSKANSQAFVILTIITVLISIFTMIGEYMAQSKDIGVKKMLGYRDSKIFYIYIFKWFVVYGIATVVIIFLSMIYLNHFSVTTFMYLAKGLFVTYCISAIVVWIISLLISRNSTVASLIKNKNVLLSLELVNSVMKSIAIIALGAIAVQTVISVKDYQLRLNQLKEYQAKGQYYAITSLSAGHEFPEEPTYNKSEFYNKIVVPNRGIYADFSEYKCDNPEGVQEGISCFKKEHAFAFVNEAYLNDYLKLEREPISRNLESTGILLLIPKSYTHKNESIEKDFNTLYNSKNAYTYKVDHYSSQQYFFTMNSSILANGEYIQKNPIFVVFNEKGLRFLDRDIENFIGMGASTSFQFQLDGPHQSLEHWFTDHEERFQDLDLNDNISIHNISETSLELSGMIQQLEATLKIEAALLVLTTFILCMSIIYALNCYYVSHRKDIAVKRLLGYPKIAIYGEYWRMSAFIHIISLFILLWILFSQNMLGIGLVFYIGILFLIELILWMIFSNKNMKNSISKVLKGE